jgi:glucosamine--fructose-6-phosphate aminotransferase (isomerizing)
LYEKTSKVLEGTFALAILNNQNPDSIYLICRDSSLVIGKGSYENFIASDYRAFIKYTNKALFLKNEEIAVVNSDKIILEDAKVQHGV